MDNPRNILYQKTVESKNIRVEMEARKLFTEDCIDAANNGEFSVQVNRCLTGKVIDLLREKYELTVKAFPSRTVISWGECSSSSSTSTVSTSSNSSSSSECINID